MNSFVDASINIHRLSRSRPCFFRIVLSTSIPRQDLIGYMRSETISLDCLGLFGQRRCRRPGRRSFSGILVHVLRWERKRHGMIRIIPKKRGVVAESSMVVVVGLDASGFECGRKKRQVPSVTAMSSSLVRKWSKY